MFYFASTAKPGKHLLVETDGEDGQLENGSVQAGSVANENDKNRSAKGNDYAGEFLFLQNLFCLSFFQVYRKQEKCEEGEEWKENKGEGFCKILLQYLSILICFNFTGKFKCKCHDSNEVQCAQIFTNNACMFFLYKTYFCSFFSFSNHIPSEPTTWRPIFTSRREMLKRGALGNASR